MHHAPQGSWARLTVRLVSPTCPEFVGPHWLALLYHCTIFIVICKGVSVVFLWRFFGIVVSRYSVRVYVERGCPADPKSLRGKGLRRFANQLWLGTVRDLALFLSSIGILNSKYIAASIAAV